MVPLNIIACVADHFGCGWFRIKIPYSFLSQHKDKYNVVITDTFQFDRATKKPLLPCDVIVLQRPGNVNVGIILEACKIYNIPLIVEIDDLLWDIPTWNPAYWYWLTNKHGYLRKTKDGIKHYINTENNLNVLKTFLHRADAVTVSTEPLAEEVKKLFPQQKVYVLPNSLIIEQWPQIDRKVKWEQSQKVVVGWGGSATHLNDVKMLQGVLSQALLKYKYVDLFFYGGTQFENILGAGFPSERIKALEWVDLDKMPSVVANIDIGLAMVDGHRFNMSKSYIKALEYSAVCSPTIASDFVTYNRFVKKNIDGLLCKTPADWIRALERLVTNHQERIEMGLRAREKAEQYDIRMNLHKWETVIHETVERKKLAKV